MNEYVENETGFDILNKDVKIGDISFADILALSIVASNRANLLGITEEDVRNQVWNISTKLR